MLVFVASCFVLLNVLALFIVYIYGKHVRTISKATHLPGYSHFHYFTLRFFNRPYFSNISNIDLYHNEEASHHINNNNSNNNQVPPIPNTQPQNYDPANVQPNNYHPSSPTSSSDSSSTSSNEEDDSPLFKYQKHSYQFRPDEGVVIYNNDANQPSLSRAMSSTSFLNSLQNKYKRRHNNMATFLSMEDPSYQTCSCYWCKIWMTKILNDCVGYFPCKNCKFAWDYQQKLDNVFLFPKYQILKAQMFGCNMWRLSLFLDNYVITCDSNIYFEIVNNPKLKNNFIDCRDRRVTNMNLISTKYNNGSESLDEEDVLNSLDSNTFERILNEKLTQLTMSWMDLFSEEVASSMESLVLEEQRHSQKFVSINLDDHLSLLLFNVTEAICKPESEHSTNTNLISHGLQLKNRPKGLVMRSLKSCLSWGISLLPKPKRTLLPMFKRSTKSNKESTINLPLPIPSICKLQLPSNSRAFCDGQEHVLLYVNRALHYLSLNPEYQQLVQQEIDENFSQREDKTVLFRTFKYKFKYCNRVVQETFRLAAPVFTYAGEALESCRIGSGKPLLNTSRNHYNIPKSSKLLVLFNLLNSDIRVWGKQSNQFNPDRFEQQSVDFPSSSSNTDSQIHPFRTFILNQK